ncbi:3-isopropylmalate dehydrogenase [Anaeromyxobacter dehalogenans 2CP-1]|uniref:3-isopropylmalate dehydrogenase n=1 Tax=Anaeromyxobacter dehalogenans (strain ATCC BAA-258 / DSM 21875 / 2CP-1) TaxID=455488 RepID=B8J738_ANAD2|nr:3-isopropylmalate dehydrogenase [Anaeromyxobacter dehalogenans]ACL65228.1 3-isopropylmalate dehydrogenase [Anaeromyxobacter dehalogenans 2CP-1]
MNAKIVVLPGDGIGPEVTAEAVRVLEAVARRGGHTLSFTERLMGGCSIDAHGTALTPEVLADCQAADAVLLGAVGGPKWDDPRARVRPEQGLLGLRKGLGVFANLRPVRVHPSLLDSSPLRPEKLRGVDIMVIRELTGGLYFGQPKGRDVKDGHARAVDTLEYQDFEVRRVVELAFRIAKGRKKKVTSVDKANVLESSRLWREIATAIGQANPDVALDHMLVDTAAMRLVTSPATLDVVVTENMFGDILTDEASVLAGSMGMLPSASIGEKGPGLYEPIHGSAPDIAGKGIANPVGTVLSAALLLRHSLGLEPEAAAIERAVDQAITDGCRTADLGGKLSTRAMADEILKRLA